MLESSRALRVLLKVVSPGRLGRPMMYGRPPGLAKIDRFYYTAACVDKRTVDRFYGYTLENPGGGALEQLDPYLEFGHFLSADRRYDYARLLPRIKTPHLMISGDGDIMSDIPSSYLTFKALSSTDKTFLRFGRNEGHIDDYGHCDLVWSRNAADEIFPVMIDWLDERQPGAAPSLQSPVVPSKKSKEPPRADADSTLHEPPHPPR